MQSQAPVDLISIESQGFRCAVEVSWSRTVVDEFELVDVPSSPFWLAGVTSIDGVVSPVIDLSSLGGAPPNAAGNTRRKRLLMGGVADENGNASYGFLFEGLPTQISGQMHPVSTDVPPKAIASAVRGTVTHPTDLGPIWVVDPSKLYQSLGNDISN